MSYSAEFLKELDLFNHKEIYAKVIALTFDEQPIEAIEGRITGGSINVDGNSAVRRTCTLTLVADNFNYEDYVWGAKSKFKLEIGVRNFINPYYDDIIWFPQGIYLLSSFNVSRSTSNFTINLSGKDKMCLLNGENGGTLESSVDFGRIEEESLDGTWIIRKVPIEEIIRNAVHVYGKEPYHNIIIEDLDTYGVELLEYRCTTPLYLYRSAEEDAAPVYDSAMLENDNTELFIKKDNGTYSRIHMSHLNGKDKEGNVSSEIEEGKIYLEPLITTLTNKDSNIEPVYTKLKVGNTDTYKPWYFTKIEYGQTAGYKETDLTYAGDLIAKVGESVTSVLDKIKNMLSDFEYFYNLKGQFVFQRKKSITSTLWSPTQEQPSDKETLPSYLAEKQTVKYTFTNNELITGFNNNPNIGNLKNDFSIWGERIGTSGAKIPVHMRYAIAEKPIKYKQIYVTENEVDSYNKKYKTELKPQTTQFLFEASTGKYNKNFSTLKVQCDWREVIYQMAQDYYKYNHLDDFEMKLIQANPWFPTGQTGYERYYIDLEGFWRELYYPLLDSEYNAKKDEYDSCVEEVNNLQLEIYGEDVDWSINKLGGIENDLTILNNLVSTEEEVDWNAAKAIVKYWNTKSNKPTDLNEYSGDAPKYSFKDEEKKLIEDPSVYLGMLQGWYFERKSLLNIKQEKLTKIEKDFKELEDDKKNNFYTNENDVYYCWNKNVYEAPYLLNFWFDFLDTQGQLSQYSVQSVGNRSKSVQDSNVKSIYFRETPKIIFREASDATTFDYVKTNLNSDTYSKETFYIFDEDHGYILTSENYDSSHEYYEKVYKSLSGYKAIQVASIEQLFTISAQGKSAKDKLDELLYTHSHCVETATITSIPIYYLQPNTRIKVTDTKSQLNGDYIINKITIPLQYNGTMSLTVTKAVADII